MSEPDARKSAREVAREPLQVFDGLDALDFSNLKRGYFQTQVDGATLHAYIHLMRSSRLVVMLHGAAEVGAPMPIFARWNWAPLLGASVLAISDPTLEMERTLRIGWYLGTDKLDAMATLPKFVRAVARACDVPEDRVCFYGSSGGGYAALRLASAMPTPRAVALNPQIDLKAYHGGDVQPLFKLLTGTTTPDDAFFKGISGVDAVAKGVEAADARFVVIQNADDVFHYRHHFSKLKARFDLEDFGVGCDGKILTTMFSDNRGHGAEPAFVAEAVQRCLIPFALGDLDGATALEQASAGQDADLTRMAVRYDIRKPGRRPSVKGRKQPKRLAIAGGPVMKLFARSVQAMRVEGLEVDVFESRKAIQAVEKNGWDVTLVEDGFDLGPDAPFENIKKVALPSVPSLWPLRASNSEASDEANGGRYGLLLRSYGEFLLGAPGSGGHKAMTELVGRRLDLEFDLSGRYDAEIAGLETAEQDACVQTAEFVRDVGATQRLFSTPSRPTWTYLSYAFGRILGGLGFGSYEKLYVNNLADFRRRYPTAAYDLPVHPAIAYGLGFNWGVSDRLYDYFGRGALDYADFGLALQVDPNFVDADDAAVQALKAAAPPHVAAIADDAIGAAYKAADAAVRAGDFDAALQQIDRAIAFSSHMPDGWVKRAETLMRMRDGAGAEAAWRMAVLLGDSRDAVGLGLIEAMVLQRKFDQAKIALAEFAAAKGDMPAPTLAAVGRLCGLLDYRTMAVDYTKAALAFDPKNAAWARRLERYSGAD